MKFVESGKIAAHLLRDLGGWGMGRCRRLARFVVWRSRGVAVQTIVRSFDVALNAHLGSRVLIERGVFIDQASSVGDYSYINQNSSIEAAQIGKFCSIARDVMVGPASHNYRNVSSHPFWYQPFYGFAPAPASVEHGATGHTTIGDDVWIGCGAVIMQGVDVASGAVIGAGSIVTKSVGPYEIWAGVPAKKIGQRFDDAVIAGLVTSGWSSLDAADIQAHVVPNMADIPAMLKAVAGVRQAAGAAQPSRRLNQ